MNEIKSNLKFHLMTEDLTDHDSQLYPFDIYFFNPTTKKYILFLQGNEPFTDQLKSVYKALVGKGMQLAIKDGQQLTFSKQFELENLPSKVIQVSNTIEKNSEASSAPNSAFTEEEIENLPEFNVNEEVVNAFDEDNFMRVIEQVRNEVSSFPQTISPTVSLAADLASKLLTSDNRINRVTALSFLLARFGGIDDVNALCDLFVASLIHQIGLTQIELELSRLPSQTLTDAKRKKYRRIEGLSHHIIKKCNLNVSDRCKKVIEESRERADGSGYPNMKREGHIDPLALILGCINHIFEFTDGTVTGNKTSIWTTIKCLENGTALPGLELKFGNQVTENAVYMIKRRMQNTEENAA